MTVAVVVARGGSVRLPGKALLPFAGTTLIGHKVRTLRACRRIDRVVVNTDSTQIAAEAVKQGADLIEGKDYHDDTRKMIADSARQMEADVIVWAHPTNPLVRAETYDVAVAKYKAAVEAGSADSLLSVTKIQRHCWGHNGVFHEPVNFDPWGEGRHPLAAELKPFWFQDGAIFIQSREAMLKQRYFYGSKPLLFEIPWPDAVDIDTAEDYEAALRLWKN